MVRKPNGEEVAGETAELAVLEVQGHRRGPDELGWMAKRLAVASDPVEAS